MVVMEAVCCWSSVISWMKVRIWLWAGYDRRDSTVVSIEFMRS